MDKDLREVVTDFLINTIESDREEFGNLPVCPFARSERINKKLMLGVFDVAVHQISDLAKEMEDSGYESALFVVKENNINVEIEGDKGTVKFANFLKKQLKENNKGEYTVICFNPRDSVEAGKYNVRSEFPFLMINIAKTEMLHKSQKHLQKTSYYDKFSKSYKKMLGIKDL